MDVGNHRHAEVGHDFRGFDDVAMRFGGKTSGVGFVP
jgi:hypothetical protein